MSNKKIMKIQYSPGLFDKFKTTKLELWHDFADIMWGLGFEMDCDNSFAEYCKTDPFALACKPPHSRREEYRNKLYVLEHANRQIVGNHLFSTYRYLTHWAYAFDEYDVDYLRRVIAILEKKFG